MDSANAVSVAVTCPQCRRAATLFVRRGTTGARTRQSWTCPHCRQGVVADLRGPVAWVLARQVDDPLAPTKFDK